MEEIDAEVLRDFRSQRVDLVEPIWGWAWQAYKRAGSLRRLLGASSLRFYSPRVEPEIQERIYAAVEEAIEQMPPDSIERLPDAIWRLAAGAQVTAEPDLDRQVEIARDVHRQAEPAKKGTGRMPKKGMANR